MSDLKARFEAAVANSKSLSERPDNATLLKLYALYKRLHDAFGTQEGSGNLHDVMKQLIEIRNRVRH